MLGVQITLPNWIYNAVRGKDLLTVSREYFRLRGGLERRFYEIARKHCGSQSRWTISIELLHKKSGSKSQLKKFRLITKRIAQDNILPDYRLQYDPEKDQATFFNRKGSKAAKAEFDAAMKTMFQPNETKKRKRSSTTQIELDL